MENIFKYLLVSKFKHNTIGIMNVENEDAVIEMAQGYFDSGSDFVLTNTFGGSPFMLKKYGHQEKIHEFNKAGAKLAKSVCPKDKFVFGSIGPTGEFLKPLGNVSEEEMSDGFKKQINGLLEGGVDGIIFETQMAIEELVLGIKTAKSITNCCTPLCNISMLHNFNTLLIITHFTQKDI